jgi:hypothetical protein
MRDALLLIVALAASGVARAQPVPTPPSASTEATDDSVRQSFAAAASFQGRLDGGWTVSARGRDLLQLQLVDKGKGRVEGAWRDLVAGLNANASGLIDPVAVSDAGLDLGFRRADGLAFRLQVRAGSDGRWTGKLWRGDEVFDVSLRRTSP